jgi:GR25 family glycosyltransferase involved in LPS biosynthesis
MKTLNDYFERVYCINLDKRHDRWELVQKEFDKQSIIATRYSAIDGKMLNMALNPFETFGQIGCLLSQLDIITKAKQDNLSSVLIMEDDVEFCDDFNERLNLKMSSLPDDWNMLFFGANHISPPLRVNEHVYKIRRAYSAHCYAINSNVYDLILDELTQLKEPLDVTYANIQPIINAYVINPHLVWQRPGYSDICETVVDYTHVHKVGF